MCSTNIDITFLGTSSATPSETRNLSSLSITFDGKMFLVDAGEGTQTQLARGPIENIHYIENEQYDKLSEIAMKVPYSRPKLSKLDKIFVTHNHGDHIFGIPGLMLTASLKCP